MKLTVYKLVYDTGGGTGCELFFREEQALDALLLQAEHAGYKGPADEEAIQDWRDNLPGNIDTCFIDAETLDIPTPQELSDAIIAEIRERPELAKCRSFSELHDYCDANMLGNTEELLEKFPLELSVTWLNKAQEIVNAYLGRRKFYIVVGRQHEGQNSCWVGAGVGEREAYEAFCDKLCEDDDITREALAAQGGPIIEYSGWSNQPIETISNNT